LRQGTHHDAQKLTTSGFPRYAARSIEEPSIAVPVIGGAGSPVFATRVDGLQPAITRDRARARTVSVRREAGLDVAEPTGR